MKNNKEFDPKCLVSVITPAKDAQAYIAQTIYSVQNQTIQNWEMIIVDDASEDQTCQIVEKFAQADPRIRLIRLDTWSGPARARNVAISLANGRYIAFLNSDDLWVNEKLEKQITFMQKENVALSYAAYQIMTENGQLTNTIHFGKTSVSYHQLLINNTIGCLTAIYDSKKLGKVFMPDLYSRQDYGLWLKILRENGQKGKGIQEVLGIYRKRKNSISSNKWRLIKYQWKLYYQIEKVGIVKSMFYTFTWAFFGFFKQFK